MPEQHQSADEQTSIADPPGAMIRHLPSLPTLRPLSKKNAWEIRVSNVLAPVVIAVAISVWFFAINSALWLDETVSYWQISGGFWRIWERQGLSFPAYSYILWATTKLLGSSEFALRVPSIVAMAGAVYLLYRIAEECFERDVALIVVVTFCVYPGVVFAAIDARPYAFALLVLNGAILSLLRWTDRHSGKYAVCFGMTSAAIFYFHYFFGVVAVPFCVYLLVLKTRGSRLPVSQAKNAVLAFAGLFLPVLSRLVYVFQTGQSHVFSTPPRLVYLYSVFAPYNMLELAGVTALVAAASKRFSAPPQRREAGEILCFILAVLPIAILFGVSKFTPFHVFIERYRLSAVPGIALCWGLLLSQINSKLIRMSFCLAVLFTAANTQLEQAGHGNSWKYAINVANASAARDHAPFLICSDLPEADYLPMPENVNDLKVGLFAPLSYYTVESPVVPLPRALNESAKAQVKKFLSTGPHNKRRFLVLASSGSHKTVDWIQNVTQPDYIAHPLGMYDGINVIEYIPQ